MSNEVNVKVFRRAGQTALDCARIFNHTETIKLLEEAAKAIPWTALQCAGLQGLQTAAKNILDSKASVDKPNKASNVSDNDVNASSENALWR
eukprot:g61317.t1